MSTDAPPISMRKFRANRRNAIKSTGPRTDQGKARSSRNAVAHGLFCKALVLPGEAPQYFRDFQCDLLKSLNPRDAMELGFVQQIISAAWRIKRVPAAAAAAFEMQQQELDQKFAADCKKREDALMMKLGAARFADRAAIQAQLETFRREIRDNPPPPRPAGELLAILLSRKESPAGLALDRLHRHEQRLAGTITRGLKQLRDLRERGTDAEPSELTHAMLDEQCDENLQNEPMSPHHAAAERTRAAADTALQKDHVSAAARVSRRAGSAWNVQNEATDPDREANSSSENELATDGAPMNTDQMGDCGFESAFEAEVEQENDCLIGSSAG